MLIFHFNIISQRRLKAIVKAAGFDLINDQIVGADGTTGGGDPATTPAKKGRAKKSPAKKVANSESPVNKRKLSSSIVDSASEEDEKQVKEETSEDAKAEQNGEGGSSGEN